MNDLKDDLYAPAEITKRFLEAVSFVVLSNETTAKSAAEVFRNTGEYQQNYSKMKKGERYVTIQQCAKFCNNYSISPDYILFSIGDRPEFREKQIGIDERIKGIEKKIEAMIYGNSPNEIPTKQPENKNKTPK